MGTTLEGKQINQTYQSLLKTTDNGEIGASNKEITDGKGNGTGISLNNSGNLTATGNVTANAFIGDGSQVTNIPYPVTSVNTQTGDVVLDTDNISEGTTNLYYSDIRVSNNSDVVSNTAKISFDSISSAKLSGIENNAQVNVQSDWNETDVNSDAYINNKPNIPSLPVESVNSKTGVVVLNTDDIAQGVVNEYYTEAKVSANIDVVANTAKVGITTEQANAIVANTAKNSYPTADATKVGHISVTQAVNLDTLKSDVTTNNAKVGITTQQATDIITNNSKVGITTEQADAIIANTAKNSYPSADATKLAGIEANADVTDTTNVAAAGALMSGTAVLKDLNDVVSTTPTDGQVLTYDTTNGWQPETPTSGGAVDSVNGATGNVVLDTDDIGEGTTNKYYTDARVAANSAVAANTAKVGITPQQISDIQTNNAKISFDGASSTKLSGIEAGAEVNDVNSVNGQTGAVSLDTADLTDIDTTAPTDGQVLRYVSASSKYVPTTLSSTAPVDSVNGQTGAVVLDADDISDATTTNKYTTASDITKLAGIEANADVTDTANVTTALNSISIKELSDVSATSPTNNQVLQFNSTSGEYEPATISTTAPVDSVNGQTGTVVLDADDISDSTTTNKWATAAEKTKLGHISVTQAVDLDTIESNVATNNAKISFDSTSSTKLAGIEDGAQVNVQSDWNAVSGDALILNKPTLFDGAFSSLTGTPTTIAGYGITDALQLGTTSTTALAGDTTTITAQQAADIVTNNAKVGITTQQASDIQTNNAKISFDSASSTKLAGIEANAQVNPTASEIKTSYESNADTNAFTDAEKTKLSGIANGAEVNVNADWNATTGDAQILNKPTLATVATTGAYSDLSGTPTIPTNNNELTNGAGYITDGNTNWDNTYGFITASSTDTLTNKSGNNSQWTNDAGYINVAAQTTHTNAIGNAIDFSARVTLAGGVAEGTSGIIKNLQSIL